MIPEEKKPAGQEADGAGQRKPSKQDVQSIPKFPTTVNTSYTPAWIEKHFKVSKWENEKAVIHCSLPSHGGPDKNPSAAIDLNTRLYHCSKCGSRKLSEALKEIGIPDPWEPEEKNLFYDYTDEDGNLLYRKIRKPGKSFTFDRKISQAPRRVLFNLQKVRAVNDAGDPLYIVEGEKDVVTLAAAGFVATTSDTGAGKTKVWNEALLALIKPDTDVFIIPDADEPGQAFMLNNAEALTRRGVRCHMIDLGYPVTQDHGKDVSDWFCEGHIADGLKILANSAPIWTQETNVKTPIHDIPEASQPSRRFRLLPADSLEFVSANWLIEDYLEISSLALIFGDPGSYKTFVALAAGLSISSGKDFYGHEAKQGPVVYICGEGKNGILKRLLAWARYNHVALAGLPFYVSTMPTALLEPVIVAQTIQALTEDLPAPPALVIIDTLNRNMGAGDENNALDMTGFIAAADRIREQFNTAVLVVHHSGHSAKDRSRGHSALKAALDFEYRCDKDGSGIVRFECTKVKDFEAPAPVAFRPRKIELETPAGESVFSIVLDLADYEPVKKGKASRGKWQTTALEVLDFETAKHRKNLEDLGRDLETARVSVDTWRDACLLSGVPRKRFYDARDSLLENEEIKISLGYVVRLSGPVSCPVPFKRETGQTGQAQLDKPDTNRTQTGYKTGQGEECPFF